MLFGDVVGDKVESQGHEEKHDANGKERAVMVGSEGSLCHFGCDGRGHGPHGIKQRGRNDSAAAGAHEHNHGLANGTGHAQHDAGADTGKSGRDNHADYGLPAGRPEGQRSFSQREGHGVQGVLGNGADSGNCHKGEHDGRVQQVEARISAKGRLNERREDNHAKETEDDGRQGCEKLNKRLDEAAGGGMRHFSEVNGREDAKGNGKKRRKGRHGQGTGEQGKNAELTGILRRIPQHAGEEVPDGIVREQGKSLYKKEEDYPE